MELARAFLIMLGILVIIDAIIIGFKAACDSRRWSAGQEKHSARKGSNTGECL